MSEVANEHLTQTKNAKKFTFFDKICYNEIAYVKIT